MDYRSHSGINWSTLKYMKSSPADYKLKRDFPPETTDAQMLGTLVHALLLEPETVPERYVVVPKLDMRKPENKETYRKIVEGNPGKILVPDESKNKTERFSWKLANKIAEVNQDKPMWKRFAANVQKAEWEMFATCPETGLKLKGLADAITPGALNDVKTISGMGKYLYNIKAFDYIGQLAYYRYLMELLGEKRKRAQILFIETIAPYKLRVVNIDPRALDAAHEQNLSLLRRLKECMANNEWPDDSETIVEYEFRG